MEALFLVFSHFIAFFLRRFVGFCLDYLVFGSKSLYTI